MTRGKEAAESVLCSGNLVKISKIPSSHKGSSCHSCSSASTGVRRYDIAEFNVPLDTVQVISETGARSSRPNVHLHLSFSNGRAVFLCI